MGSACYHCVQNQTYIYKGPNLYSLNWRGGGREKEVFICKTNGMS